MFPLLKFYVQEKLHGWLNTGGIVIAVGAWALDNIALLTNLFLFAVPTAIYNYYRYKQKLKTQRTMDALDIAKKKQELKQDEEKHNKELNG